MRKNKSFASLLVLAMFLAIGTITGSTASAQDRNLSYQAEAAQSKCPDNAKCGFYIGAEDRLRTDVQISNGAAALLSKWGIALRNEGTKLVWVTNTCRDNEANCANIDLTGRKKGYYIPDHDLNKSIRMNAVGKNSVKMAFVEFDNDEDSYTLTNGKPPASMPTTGRQRN